MQPYHAIIYGLFKILLSDVFFIFPLGVPGFLWYTGSKDYK